MLRADARLRRQTLIALSLASILAVVAIVGFRHWLAGLGMSDGTDLLILRLRRMIGIGLTGSAICAALLAWYVAHQASRVRATGQWPIPGARVIQDTAIRRGDAARKIITMFQATALVLLVLVFALGYGSVRLLGAA